MMSLRIKIIQFLIKLNENIFFYPSLKAFYKSIIKFDSPVIIDVGANDGQSIRFFLKLFPNAKIFSFEPNPKLYNKLLLQFRGNNNINIFNKGVSNIVGKLFLNETVTDETSTFEELNYDSSYLNMKSRILGIKSENIISSKYEVDVITLDIFFKEMNLQKIDILKIDTEGHEMICLQGLFSNNNHNVDYIQIEHHDDDMYKSTFSSSQFSEYFLGKGYKLQESIQHGFGNFKDLIYKKHV
jgi:FkbM family methyltransferase